MKIRGCVFFVLFFCCFLFSLRKTSAQNSSYIELFSNEIILSHSRIPIIARVRTREYLYPLDFSRTDVMLGVNIKKAFDMDVLGYLRLDSRNRQFTGIRTENRFRFLDDKLYTAIRFVYIRGLNHNGRYMFTPVVIAHYELKKWFLPGFYGWVFLGETNVGRRPVYLGPSVTFRISRNISFYVTYGKDVLHEGHFMLVKLFLKFKFGPKEEEKIKEKIPGEL